MTEDLGAARRSLKRPAGTDTEAEAPNKRPHVDTQAALTELPDELHLQILGHALADGADDPRHVLRTVKAIAQVNGHFRALVNNELATERVGGGWTTGASARASRLISQIERGKDAAKHIAKGTGIQNKADLMGLRPKQKRGPIFDRTLAMPAGTEKTDVLHNLIGNLGHLGANDPGKLVAHVCAIQRDTGGADDLIRELLQRSHHLERHDLNTLAQTVIDIKDASEQRICLDAFAGRMSRLDSRTQADLLRHVGANTHDKAFSLGRFAARLDDIAPEHRPDLVDAVLALPENEPGRMWAMSGLAAHLELVCPDQQHFRHDTLHRVVDDILSKAEQGPQSRRDPDWHLDHPWQSEPSLCALEAVHHLENHRALLDDDARQRTGRIVRDVLDATPPDLARQAQLITHMPDDRRRGFVAHALESTSELAAHDHDHDDGDGDDDDLHHREESEPVGDHVVAALTLRMRSLSPEETRAYVDHLCDGDSAESALRDDVLNHNMSQQLDHFSEREKTRLIVERLDTMGRYDPEGAIETYGHVVENAKLMNFSNLQAMLEAGQREVVNPDMVDQDGGTAFARQLAALSAQAVADWSTQQTAAIVRRRAAGPRSLHNAPAEPAYDERPRDRVPMR